jgi:hypothetical protein
MEHQCRREIKVFHVVLLFSIDTSFPFVFHTDEAQNRKNHDLYSNNALPLNKKVANKGEGHQKAAAATNKRKKRKK